MGELAIASRSAPPAGCSARLVCDDLRRTGSQTGRDPARCRFHRRSNVRAATAQFLQRRLRPTHVSPPSDLLAAHPLFFCGALSPPHRREARPHPPPSVTQRPPPPENAFPNPPH